MPTDESDLEVASQALFNLGRKFSKFPQHDFLSAKQGRPVELSYILVVQAIAARQGMEQEVTIGTIATHLEIDPSTASRLVAMTERAGYLARKTSLADGRATQLELTPAGVKLAADARQFQQSIFEQITSDWSDEERRTFVPLFIKFVDGVVESLAVQRRAEINK
jgi:DNA-binding MarR family transcriptional regulator